MKAISATFVMGIGVLLFMARPTTGDPDIRQMQTVGGLVVFLMGLVVWLVLMFRKGE
jgi:hypothetical protein